ncbi:hypothetical protein [Sphingobium chlorophenolicum]|uniref:hypothetical protein n=1 Tax=Sphingobium chlorophenolicum TaxID=46429 RepID=UPI0001E53A2D|nr:hypothetical protein [Sphingobium chlorophenolicum]
MELFDFARSYEESHHAVLFISVCDPFHVARAAAKYCKRGDVFGIVKLWIEARQMIEPLTEEMQAEYFATTGMDNYRAILKAIGPT